MVSILNSLLFCFDEWGINIISKNLENHISFSLHLIMSYFVLNLLHKILTQDLDVCGFNMTNVARFMNSFAFYSSS